MRWVVSRQLPSHARGGPYEREYLTDKLNGKRDFFLVQTLYGRATGLVIFVEVEAAVAAALEHGGAVEELP